MKLWGWVLALALSVTVGACKEGPPAPVKFRYGLYVLQTLDGQKPPLTVDSSDAGYRELMSSSLTLEHDPNRSSDSPGGRFTRIVRIRFVPAKGQPTQPRLDKSAGVFFATPTGLKLRFNGTPATDHEAQVSDDDRITVTLQAKTYIYGRVSMGIPIH